MIGNVDIGALVASLGMDITEFKEGLKEAEKRMKEAQETISDGMTNTGRSIEKVAQKFSSMGTLLKRIGRDLSLYITTPLVGIGTAAVKAEADFEFSLSKIISLVGVSRDQVAAWREELFSLGGEVAQTPQKLAEALYFITSAGVRGADALDVLKVSAAAASAGMGDVKVVADLVTDAMNAFGRENLNAEKTMDILVNAVRLGKVEAEDLVSSMGHVFPVAAKLNVSLNDVAAAIVAMTRTGTPAETAAVQVRQFLSQLIGPSEEAQKAFAILSNAMEDTDISARSLRETMVNEGLFAALKQFNDAIEEVGSFEIAKDIFGNIRALTGVFDIMGKNIKDNAMIFEEMGDSTGRFRRAVEVASETLKWKWNAALADANSALIAVGETLKEALIPILEEVSEWLRKTADWFSSLTEEEQKTILKTAAIVAALGPVITILGILAKSISNILFLFSKLRNGFLVLNTAISANSAAILNFVKSTGGMITALGTIIYLLSKPQIIAQKSSKAIEDLFASMKGLDDMEAGEALFKKIEALPQVINEGRQELEKWAKEEYNIQIKVDTEEVDAVENFKKQLDSLGSTQLKQLTTYLNSYFKEITTKYARAQQQFNQGLIDATELGKVKEEFEKIQKYVELANAELEATNALADKITKSLQYKETDNFFKRLRGEVEATFESFEKMGQVFKDFDVLDNKVEFLRQKIEELFNIENRFKVDSKEVQYLIGLLEDLGGIADKAGKDLESSIAEAFFKIEEEAAGMTIFGDFLSETEIAYQKVDALKEMLEDVFSGGYGDNLIDLLKIVERSAQSLQVPLSTVGRMIEEYKTAVSQSNRLAEMLDLTPLERVNNELSLTKTLIENIASKSIISEEEISKLSALIAKYKELENVQIQLQAQMEQANSVASVLGSTVSTLMQGIGEAIAGSFDFRSFLSSVAQLMIRLGEAIVVTSKAWIAFKTFLTTLPTVSLAAGLALIAAGAALAAGASAKSTSSGPPGNYPIAFADGGIVYGPTNAIIGEYPGARTNPEVVSPLSTLKKLISNEPSGGQVEFKIDGYVLKGILNKMNKKKNVI